MPMPSVGMRRSTRVCVPKMVGKDADGARVLRSGRRLWSDSREEKPGRSGDGDEWFRLLNNSGDAADVHGCKDNGWHEEAPELKIDIMDVDGEMELPNSVNRSPGEPMAEGSVVKMYGIVYHRKQKRRRLTPNTVDSLSNSEVRGSGDKMYGIPFVRKQRRKKQMTGSFPTEFPIRMGLVEGNTEVSSMERDESGDFVGQAMLAVVIESSCSSSCRFTCFLNSVLSYMMRARVRLSELSAFMCSKPITHVFSSQGIHFLPDLLGMDNWQNGISSSGICKIFGARQFIPLFSVNFSAVPRSFMYLYSSMFLRSTYNLDVSIIKWMDLHKTAPPWLTDSEKRLSCIPTVKDISGSRLVSSGNTSEKRSVVDPFVGAPKLAARSEPRRHNANFRNVRKRRSSMRAARIKSPLLGDLHTSSRALASDFISVRDDCIPFSSLVSNYEHKKLVQQSSPKNIKELKSTSVTLRQNMDSHCSANILVIESDKCYREEGVNVMLECSSSKEWFLAVKTQGSTKYIHRAHDVMRTCTSNRFTHAMIWTGENGWKLEFSNRRDWLIFKELHRECCDRNVRAAAVRIIPVPGVCEVSGYGNMTYVPFVRPDSYITVNENEVSRAMSKRTANYDMDHEDEEWLKKHNNEFNAENGLLEHLSAENFELMVDVFEKAFYCTPDDVSDEETTTNLCLNLGTREVVAAVYNYWLKKRKQKGLALVRVFQCHPPRRAQLIQKPFFRKRRSFKRQASQFERGKQQSSLQALWAEHDDLAEQKAILRVQEAKHSARKSVELAVRKRRRAQVLMENADLAAYKATLVLKIAEAATITESLDVATASFLG
ncbi:hypothetical protein HHK36_011341 [Tetracentron sinense]|uniref:Enhancer of polycomb-like protein n=1 Tax=Tetracentron sinense TaxID=13715 RepID=A0A834ZCL5_TETSI|nr:hypothetical protein HHK36_011341 [Tetracentron sinense]